MVEKLGFTGERFTPECEREIWYEHIHRYALASRFCRGRDILDAACGEGYGSALLASHAASVTAVDLDGDTISHARNRYGQHSNLQFQVADCTKLPFEDNRFDAIVSFETIEHLEAQEALVAEFHRVLKPGGFLMLSCPDKAEYSDKRNFENEYHVKELYRDELQQLLKAKFPVCRLMGQKLMFHSVIWDLGPVENATVQTLNDNGDLAEGSIPHNPMYFIALCAENESCLPKGRHSASLFDDLNESVYAHYQHEIRKNMSAGGILAERDAELEELGKELSRVQSASWWRRLFGKK